MTSHRPTRALATVAALTAVAAGTAPAAVGAPADERIVSSIPLPGGGAAVVTLSPDGSGVAEVTLPAMLEDFNRSVWSHDGARLLHSNVMVFDGAGELVAFRPATSAPDGTDFELLELPQLPMDMYCSAWSPDDQRLVCSASDGGLVSLRASDGGDLVALTENPYGGQDLAVGYSPDGTRLAFLRERPGAPDRPVRGHDTAEREALFVANADGSAARRITEWGKLHAHELAGANWSPDGLSLVSATPRGKLVEIAADGSRIKVVPLDLGPDNYFAVTPDYSPDGEQVVFSLFRGGPAELYVAGTDGSDPHAITETPEEAELFPDWTTTP